MKKIGISLLILICLFTITAGAFATNSPQRNSVMVNDVFQPYTTNGSWIISPDDDPVFFKKVDNAPECAIRGVISCYDDKYLRTDILLNNSISPDLDLIYGIKLEYIDMNEYYIYHTYSKKLTYKKEKNGEIVEIRDLTNDSSGDEAGITYSPTSTGNLNNSDVYFIINKAYHINGQKGQTYYLTSNFFSKFVTDSGDEKYAYQTIDVDLYFMY